MFKIYFRYGIGIAVVLIIYFLLLKVIGLHEYPILSAANGLIFAAGIFMAQKKYRSNKNNFKYEKGFELGLLTGGLATVIFTIFMAVYMYQIDAEFAQNILESWQLEYDSGTAILLLSLLLMGFSTTLVLTLAFMQLLKNSWNTPEGDRKTFK